tara:strand:+ start:857 stop:1291 length:435 start_codon:yes stop_codon:yes gene_type:complete
MDIWEKYKSESYQTLCIIGILVLSAKLCKADGHFSQHEKDEILKILPHEKNQKRIIENILDEGAADKNDISFHAQVIKKKLGDNKEFLEFILAVLYKLGHSDHVYSEEEDLEIRKVAHEFGIKENILSKALNKFSLNIFKINNA